MKEDRECVWRGRGRGGGRSQAETSRKWKGFDGFVTRVVTRNKMGDVRWLSGGLTDGEKRPCHALALWPPCAGVNSPPRQGHDSAIALAAVSVRSPPPLVSLHACRHTTATTAPLRKWPHANSLRAWPLDLEQREQGCAPQKHTRSHPRTRDQGYNVFFPAMAPTPRTTSYFSLSLSWIGRWSPPAPTPERLSVRCAMDDHFVAPKCHVHTAHDRCCAAFKPPLHCSRDLDSMHSTDRAECLLGLLRTGTVWFNKHGMA